MIKYLLNLRHSLVFKLIILVGIVLAISMSIWAYFNINYQKRRMMENIMVGTDRLTHAIRLGTYYAMMHNSRNDINQIIKNIGKQPDIENIRIYNKAGKITYSNRSEEVEQVTNIRAEACYICHRKDPPLTHLKLEERARIFQFDHEDRLLGIITPIYNEPECSTGDCHFHPADKKILGALDVVVSLADVDREIIKAQEGIIGLSIFIFLVTSAIIFVFLLRFVSRPVKALIRGTELFAGGDYSIKVNVSQDDEMGQLAKSINQMGESISKHEAELNIQRDEYQNLFEKVPCLITVQDRDFKLLKYNQKFADRFAPESDDYCYHAYKGQNIKCIDCPVEKTFKDGRIHTGEESGPDKDGSLSHWLFRTSPIFNSQGDVVAAMEISLDITQRKELEQKLAQSEKKYRDIFNNIPNPVFMLDVEGLKILDCNESALSVYGYPRQELIGTSFMLLFTEGERNHYAFKLMTTTLLNQVKQVNKAGKNIYVTIRVSLYKQNGRSVLLVTTSDITKRLEAEQQLIQASKMATLGEMATGVAHELNQPLSVIKTASSFLIKKINNQQEIDGQILETMLTKIDANVDRASRIIIHMREFARKSDQGLLPVQLHDVLMRAIDIFSQQLKIRGIEVVWDMARPLPRVLGDPDRLEQVFINLLINARDAIEEKWAGVAYSEQDKRLTLRSRVDADKVVVEVCDTGGGIPESLRQKIFEPFFTTKEVGKGTGLGLSISYGIIKDCRGQIEARPNPDGGACFVLSFRQWKHADEENNSDR